MSVSFLNAFRHHAAQANKEAKEDVEPEGK
jgi:hypothetical protein